MNWKIVKIRNANVISAKSIYPPKIGMKKTNAACFPRLKNELIIARSLDFILRGVNSSNYVINKLFIQHYVNDLIKQLESSLMSSWKNSNKKNL